ncbi:hypothetical protein AKJ50_00570 [candidate division MSBL1 archaeon SCGC-AAA382A13]|uniref:HNH nuclease domain-containing protein n=1 Tax=candidate division MSBL1 archaeon SCGC-AAA382A13 TaxID=1698279 RepID=A0A133VGK8_9EURY|nr:hypothetical protein AKJ50_00570 [candidate division MSBL1 archaeon SCGC-AAA382A13]
MSFSRRKLPKIFNKTNGRCRYCGKPLVFRNYGQKRSLIGGRWEVDHSKPKAKGGTDHLNNLYPACISCNRSKGDTRGRNTEKETLAWPF